MTARYVVFDAMLQMPREQPTLTVVFMGLFGLCAGSFANVCIYRLPRYCLSIVHPRSFCPACEAPIAWYDNLPLISWALWLRGKCRRCRAKIPARYPLVELLMGVFFAVLARQVLVKPDTSWLPMGAMAFPSTDGSVTLTFIDGIPHMDVLRPEHWALFALWAAAGVALLTASVIDIRMRIIPDRISVGGTIAVFALAPLIPMLQRWGVPRELVEHDATLLPTWSLLPDVLAPWFGTGALMLGAALFLWLLGEFGALLAPRAAKAAGGGMGLGDVKLVMLLIGLLGWPKMALAFFVAVLVGATWGFPQLIRKWRGVPGASSVVPFGPFLSIGTAVSMLWARPLFDLIVEYMNWASGRAL